MCIQLILCSIDIYDVFRSSFYNATDNHRLMTYSVVISRCICKTFS